MKRCKDRNSDVRSTALSCLVKFADGGSSAKSTVVPLVYGMSTDPSSCIRDKVLDFIPKLAERGDKASRDSVLQILEAANGAEENGSALKALSLVACRGDPRAVTAVLSFRGGRARASFQTGWPDRSVERTWCRMRQR